MTKKIRFVLTILFLAVFSLACNLSTFTSSSEPQHTGELVFQSDSYGNPELFTVDIATHKVVRLTNDTANEEAPTYIKASDQIGYVSDQDDGWNLYTMDLSRKSVSKVLNAKDVLIYSADWSLDGKSIAISLAENCTSSSTSCPYDIYVANYDGSDLTKLTYSLGQNASPSWSPDGKKIAFDSDRGGDSEIYVMDKDGTHVEQLTDNDNFDGNPKWSPDGKLISFESDRDGGDWDIYVMNADGSDQHAITSNSSSDYTQSWSPDGKWIVYVSSEGNGNNQILLVDLHGQNEYRVIDDKSNILFPTWIDYDPNRSPTREPGHAGGDNALQNAW